MTREELLERIAALQKQLNELDTLESADADSTLAEAERERQRQEDLERLRGLRLIDDEFMNACFDGYVEGAELVVRVILGKPDIRVNSVRTQSRLKNLLGRDVTLDIDAVDEAGVQYDIEVQRSDKGAGRKRARYYSSILDAHLLKPGDAFSDLPETYVIMITEHDVLGGGKPLYRVERRIEETKEPFGDGEHIIYVNGADRNAKTALGYLMHDFFCTDPDDMYYRELADRTRYFKEDEKGVAAMSKIFDDMRREAAEKATERTTERLTVAHLIDIMRKLSYTVEQAMDLLSVPESKREEYAARVAESAQ